jgi:hypothetical protein
MATPMTRPTGVTDPGFDGRTRRLGLLSLAFVAWFPFAVFLLPVVGGAIGLQGDGSAADVSRWAIVLAYFFTPFVIGAVLGWRGVRAHLRDGHALAAWLGLIGNLVILLLSALFATGEVLHPH